MVGGLNGVVITYFSTASAVGKTLLSINMASELARQGSRVCLVDMDLQFGDVEDYLGIHPEYDLADVHMFMKDESSYDAEMIMFLSNYSHKGVNFCVLPSPKDLTLAYNIDPNIAGKIIEQLRTMFDYVVVDTTSMFSELNMILLDLSTIVTFLGIVDFIPTIRNMKIGMDTLRSLNYDADKIRLVLNRSDAKTDISIGDVEELLGERFFAVLPNDYKAASQSIKTGIPLVLSGARSALTTELRNLIALYTNHEVAEDGYDDDIEDQNEPFLTPEEKAANPVIQQPKKADEEQEWKEYDEYTSRRDRRNSGAGWFSKLFG